MQNLVTKLKNNSKLSSSLGSFNGGHTVKFLPVMFENAISKDPKLKMTDLPHSGSTLPAPHHNLTGFYCAKVSERQVFRRMSRRSS